MGQARRHTPLGEILSVGPHERALWVALGTADPNAVEVLTHAAWAAEQGPGIACPFTDVIAAQRWQWMFDQTLKGIAQRQARELDAGELPL